MLYYYGLIPVELFSSYFLYYAFVSCSNVLSLKKKVLQITANSGAFNYLGLRAFHSQHKNMLNFWFTLTFSTY